MAGSIDPRCETLRGIHWPVKVAGLFGPRDAETILASGPPNRINRPDIWMQAIRSDHQKLLRHGGRPHMGPGSRFAWPGRREFEGRLAYGSVLSRALNSWADTNFRNCAASSNSSATLNGTMSFAQHGSPSRTHSRARSFA